MGWAYFSKTIFEGPARFLINLVADAIDATAAGETARMGVVSLVCFRMSDCFRAGFLKCC